MTERNNRKNSSDSNQIWEGNFPPCTPGSDMPGKESKDERYWHFRKQNNMAAKQSRNAHKAKIEQATKQVDILEKKNKFLSDEIKVIKSESSMLKKMLEKYEPSI